MPSGDCELLCGTSAKLHRAHQPTRYRPFRSDFSTCLFIQALKCPDFLAIAYIQQNCFFCLLLKCHSLLSFRWMARVCESSQQLLNLVSHIYYYEVLFYSILDIFHCCKHQILPSPPSSSKHFTLTLCQDRSYLYGRALQLKCWLSSFNDLLLSPARKIRGRIPRICDWLQRQSRHSQRNTYCCTYRIRKSVILGLVGQWVDVAVQMWRWNVEQRTVPDENMSVGGKPLLLLLVLLVCLHSKKRIGKNFLGQLTEHTASLGGEKKKKVSLIHKQRKQDHFYHAISSITDLIKLFLRKEAARLDQVLSLVLQKWC